MKDFNEKDMEMDVNVNNIDKQIQINEKDVYDNFEKVGTEGLPLGNISLICRGFFVDTANPIAKIIKEGKTLEGYWVYGLPWFDSGKVSSD